MLDCHASCKHVFGMESALGYFETCRMKLPMSFPIRKHNTHGTHCYAMMLGQDKKANVFGQILDKQPMLFHVFLDMETTLIETLFFCRLQVCQRAHCVCWYRVSSRPFARNALNFFLGLRARLLEAKGGKSRSVSGIFGEIFNGGQASNLERLVRTSHTIPTSFESIISKFDSQKMFVEICFVQVME